MLHKLARLQFPTTKLIGLYPVSCWIQSFVIPCPAPAMRRAAAVDGTVPLRRAVVEDMLVQRLTDRQAGAGLLAQGMGRRTGCVQPMEVSSLPLGRRFNRAH